ncbi:MAG: hemerythrin domain-containing protein, partial [Thermodesulfobacteriota bacterium]
MVPAIKYGGYIMEYKERWDDFLISEHELIERSMAVLKGCLDTVETGRYDSIQMSRSIDFLLEIGDKIHNKKEEDFLFPLMQKRGIPSSGGPISVMLQEHQAERELLSKMLKELPGLSSASSSAKSGFKARGIEYLQIRANHIWKENDVLYPIGRKVFQDQDNIDLLNAFRNLDQALYGPEARTRYLKMVEEAETETETKKGVIYGLSYEQIEAIMETLPLEITFVDAADTVAYFNRLDKSKIFPRTRSAIGRKVDKCHPEKSIEKVLRI